MKAEIELTIDAQGNPVLQLRHHDKDNSLEQKLLGRFVEGAKENGIKLSFTSGHLKMGTNESWDNYEIRVVND